MNPSILSSRFSSPRPRNRYVVRERLFHKLDEMKECTCALIEAGAGCGKTTLVASYFMCRPQYKVSWLTLDKTCDDSFMFWEYMIKALLKYHRNEKHELLEYLRDILQQSSMERILIQLLNDLEQVDEDYYLVLDNMQDIQDKVILSQLEFFLSKLVPSIHVILLTREHPDLYLGNLLVSGRLFMMTHEDLKFSYEEEVAFLQQTLALSIDHSLLETMCNMAQGWIGGLQLLSMLGMASIQENLSQLHLSKQLLEEYITRELLKGFHEEQIAFMTRTSILQYFNKELCESLMPDVDFREMMESLFQKNVLLTILDDKKGIYCYHDILKDYFQHQFQLLEEQERKQLHHRAAVTYLKLHDYGECLRHDLEIPDYDHAMKVMVTMTLSGEAIAYMKKIPMEVIVRNPDFAYQYFFYYYSNFEDEKCEKIYQLLQDKLSDDETFKAFEQVNIFLAREMKSRNHPVLPLEDIMKLPLSKGSKAVALIKDAYLLFVNDRIQESYQYLEEAEKVYLESQNTYIGFFLYTTKSQLYEYLGEFRKSLQAYDATYLLLDKAYNLRSSYYVGIAGVYVKQMRIEDAKIALEQAQLYIKEDSSNIQMAHLYTSAQLYMIQKDENKANEMITLLHDREDISLVRAASLLKLYWIHHPTHPYFSEFEQEYIQSEDEEIDHDGHLLHALLLHEAGNVDEAMALSEKVLAYAREYKNKYVLVEASLWKLVFLYKDPSHRRTCVNQFIEALYYAARENIQLPFWMIQKDLEGIYRTLYSNIKDRLTETEEVFLSKLQLTKKDNRLSIREAEVLEELSKGRTNKEIADTLCISLATVKSHIINIYNKLQVKNRIEAAHKYERYKDTF